MVVHVLERVRLATRVDRVLVATDDPRIAAAVRAAGGEAVLTSDQHTSGTDRVEEAVRGLDAAFDVVINVQGDEPLLDPSTVDAVLAAMDDPDVPVATAMAPLSEAEAHEPARVKVVRDEAGRALYFSRAPIPHGGPWWVHVGIYAYRRATLARFAQLPSTPLERLERLEQLRLLENGVPIRVVPVPAPSLSVDTPADLARIRALLGDPTPI